MPLYAVKMIARRERRRRKTLLNAITMIVGSKEFILYIQSGSNSHFSLIKNIRNTGDAVLDCVYKYCSLSNRTDVLYFPKVGGSKVKEARKYFQYISSVEAKKKDALQRVPQLHNKWTNDETSKSYFRLRLTDQMAEK